MTGAVWLVPSLSLAPWIDVFVAFFYVGHGLLKLSCPILAEILNDLDLQVTRYFQEAQSSCSLWVMNSPPDGHLFFADSRAGSLCCLRMAVDDYSEYRRTPKHEGAWPVFFHVFESISNIVPSNWMWHRCGPIICGSFSIIFLCKAGVPWIFFNIRGRCKKTDPDFGRVSWDPWDPGSPWILPWDFGKFHPKEVKHGTSTKILNTPTMSVVFLGCFFLPGKWGSGNFDR